MKRLSIYFLLMFPLLSFAQEAEVKVSISNTEVLLGNYVIVKFSLNNASGTFNPPDFNNMRIISGPNVSSNYSMVNGNVSQSVGYSFHLQPEDVGDYTIGSASFQVGDIILETQPFVIPVLLNPDDVIQNHREFITVGPSIKTDSLYYDSEKLIQNQKLKRFRKKY